MHINTHMHTHHCKPVLFDSTVISGSTIYYYLFVILGKYNLPAKRTFCSSENNLSRHLHEVLNFPKSFNTVTQAKYINYHIKYFLIFLLNQVHALTATTV